MNPYKKTGLGFHLLSPLNASETAGAQLEVQEQEKKRSDSNGKEVKHFTHAAFFLSGEGGVYGGDGGYIL